MRIFYALTFDSSVKQELSNYSHSMMPYFTKGKFTLADNYHLTLFFIGNIDENDLPMYKNLLFKIKSIPLSLKISGINSFLKKNRHIVFFDIHKEPLLTACERELANLLAKKDIYTDFKNYHPHVTIGRNIVLNDTMPTLPHSPISIKVKGIALMESKRVDGVLSYQPILEIPIQ